MAPLSDEERCDRPWDECDDVLAERNALRADLATAREDLQRVTWLREIAGKRNCQLLEQRDEARALLAEGSDGGNENCGCIFTKPEKCWTCRTRAFLRDPRRADAPRHQAHSADAPCVDCAEEYRARDEARRCEHGWPVKTCPTHMAARDEAREYQHVCGDRTGRTCPDCDT